MRPDVRINEYYLSFITNAKKDILNYQKEINRYELSKSQQYNLIIEYKSNYETLFKIYLEDEHVAIKRAKLLINTENNPNRRFLLSLILKYSFTLDKIKEYKIMLKLATKRKNLPYKRYHEIVNTYYCKVHKFVLQGLGYKYSHGIGTLCICRWKVKNNQRKRIDFKATNERKQELIKLGKKLYNKDEAELCAKKGIPYNGVDYRVYLDITHLYLIDIVKSKLFKLHNHIFDHPEYVNRKFQGMGYKAMADLCKDVNEIYDFPVDLRVKLNMLLYKDPSKYICFIRNEDEDINKYGAHNS